MAQSITSPARHREIDSKPGYRIGDDGTIWSCIKSRRGDRVVFGEWKQLKPHPQSRGHCTVELGRGNIRFVHRLVLEAFVGPCPEGMECRHLDGNPGNNALWNLAWGTKKENQADSVRHGTAFHLRPEAHEHAADLWSHVEHKRGERHHRAKLTDEQVAIILETVPGNRGMAATLARKWGVSGAAIRLIASGRRRVSQPIQPLHV